MNLRSARRKLGKAREHLSVLEDEIRAFAATLPPPDEVDEGELHLYRRPVVPDPPEHLALIAGDAIQNLRAALDHAIFALSRAANPSLDASKTAFPICDTPPAFRKDAKSIQNLDDAARLIVEHHQPYNDPKGTTSLALLRDLSNVDKHREIPLVLTYMRSGNVTIGSQTRRAQFYGDGILGQTVAGGPLIGFERTPGAYWAPSFETGIVFGPGVKAHRQRVHVVLPGLYERCIGIISELEAS